MNIVTNSARLISEKDPFKKLEYIGRVCYKSDDRITEDSAVPFVRNLINRKHFGILEHYRVVFKASIVFGCCMKERFEYGDSLIKVTRTEFCPSELPRYLISANVRAINESGIHPLISALYDVYPDLAWAYDSKMRPLGTPCEIVDIDSIPNLTEKEKMVHKDMTVLITTDRGVTHELVRHRKFSYAQESTRYCNYSNNKFGRGLTCITTNWFLEESSGAQEIIKNTLRAIEKAYIELVDEYGMSAQKARAILPNALKSDIVMTGTFEDWEHFFDVRYFESTGAVHPDMKEVSTMVYDLYHKVK